MSQVCKFFQTNSCRYGQRCRFLHVYEEPEYYDPPPKSHGGTSILTKSSAYTKINTPPQPKSNTNIKGFVEDVAAAVQFVEDSKLWPLSCFCCVQSYGNLEGFEDISPEELRAQAYLAIASGKVQEYIEYENTLKQKAAAIRTIFKNKGPTAEGILKDYISKSRNTNLATQSSSSVFGQIASPAQNSPFLSTQSSIFGASPQSSFQVHGFGQTQPSQPSFAGIFAQALEEEKTNLQASPFNQPSQTNIFGQPLAPAPEPMSTVSFGAASASNNASDFFKSNLFGSAVQDFPGKPQHSSNSPFFQSQTSFSSSTKTPGQLESNNMYSKMEDLKKEELQQFKATKFTYRLTPLKPPPKELC